MSFTTAFSAAVLLALRTKAVTSIPRSAGLLRNEAASLAVGCDSCDLLGHGGVLSVAAARVRLALPLHDVNCMLNGIGIEVGINMYCSNQKETIGV